LRLLQRAAQRVEFVDQRFQDILRRRTGKGADQIGDVDHALRLHQAGPELVIETKPHSALPSIA